MNFTDDGMMTISEDGLIESCNDAASRIFGYERAEVIGMSVSLLLPDSDHQNRGTMLDAVMTCRDKKRTNRMRKTFGRRKDGRTFPLEIGISEVPIESGYIILAVFRSIDAR